MTLLEARKLKIGDKVRVKYTNSIIEITNIAEKSGCGIKSYHYIEISDQSGGRWTHKQISNKVC